MDPLPFGWMLVAGDLDPWGAAPRGVHDGRVFVSAHAARRARGNARLASLGPFRAMGGHSVCERMRTVVVGR